MPLQHGVIAQELKEIYPDCVKETAVAINLGYFAKFVVAHVQVMAKR